jgi:hypothetical protein
VRRVDHLEIVADRSHDDFTRIESHAYGEAESPCTFQLRGVSAKFVPQMQGRVAGTPGVILVGDGRPEDRHDPIAGELIDRPLETVHAVGEDLEEAVHDPIPLFWIDLLAELHRALHVSEEHRHLLPLAFEGAARREDPLGEMARCVSAR